MPLFAATIPGVLAMVSYMIVIAIYVRLVPGHAPASPTWSCRKMQLRTVLGLAPIATVFLLVFGGGTHGGFFRLTEGAQSARLPFLDRVLVKGDDGHRQQFSWPPPPRVGQRSSRSSSARDVMNSTLALSQV